MIGDNCWMHSLLFYGAFLMEKALMVGIELLFVKEGELLSMEMSWYQVQLEFFQGLLSFFSYCIFALALLFSLFF